MSNQEPDDDLMDVAEFIGQLEELEDGTLEPARIETLMGCLNTSRAARQIYLEYFRDSATLHDIAKTLDAQGKMPVAPNVRESQKTLRRSALAAAAIVIFGGIIAAMFEIRKSPVPVVSSAAVAGTQWTVDGQARGADEENLAVHPGMTVRVASGSVRLEQESGSTLVIQGPAEVSFPSLDRPHLMLGWLWIDSGKNGKAFTVRAPDVVVRNIGTRFGVRVPQEGPTEVHLIDGRVQVHASDSGTLLRDFESTGEAVAIAMNGEVEEIPPAVDPLPDLPDLLTKPANYRTTLLSQAPVGYWSLDEPKDGFLANEIRDGSVGFHGQAVRGGEPGIGAEAEFRGFGEANRSLFIDGYGSAEQSAILGLDGFHGVNRREGAVSFWIRRSVDVALREEMLWMAGYGSEDMVMPSRAILHTRITADGWVVFEVENGDARVSLSSSRSIADGRWHHVTASWGPSSVDLYIDGRLIGRDSETRTLAEGSFSGRFVRFGKPSLDLKNKVDSFTGWVDEIALWDRPLSPTEVACQFKEAVGSAK